MYLRMLGFALVSGDLHVSTHAGVCSCVQECMYLRMLGFALVSKNAHASLCAVQCRRAGLSVDRLGLAGCTWSAGVMVFVSSVPMRYVFAL